MLETILLLQATLRARLTYEKIHFQLFKKFRKSGLVFEPKYSRLIGDQIFLESASKTAKNTEITGCDH